MGYLEVKISGNCALSANGVSLGSSSGCLAALFGSINYPELTGYVEGLEREGWELISSRTQSYFGMVDGLPFRNENESLIFRGYGRFEVVWNNEETRWRFTGYKDDEDY